MPVLSPCRRVEGSHVSVAPLDKLGIASKRGELVEPYRGAGFPPFESLRAVSPVERIEAFGNDRLLEACPQLGRRVWE